MDFFFFFFCLFGESERKRGEKSQLEAWKTVTLHSGSCNILTTKMKQEGEKKQGERETEKQGERRASFERHK